MARPRWYHRYRVRAVFADHPDLEDRFPWFHITRTGARRWARDLNVTARVRGVRFHFVVERL